MQTSLQIQTARPTLFGVRFWKGIHIAELDTDTGLVKGIDYTSDETILSSSQKFGTRLFSTPSGVVRSGRSVCCI